MLPLRTRSVLPISGLIRLKVLTGSSLSTQVSLLEPPRCIELVLETRPDPLELIPLLGETGSRTEGAAGSAPVTVTKLDLRETVRLLTEPETLVPRRLSTRQRALVTVRLPDGRLHTDTLDRAADLVFHPET